MSDTGAGCAPDVLQIQLQSIPVVNQAVEVVSGADVPEGCIRLSAPLRRNGLSRWLGRVVTMSKERVIELDRVGKEFFGLCDGEHTVEEIIDHHMERWQLSFYEARALTLQFLYRLMKYEFILILAPALEGEEEDEEDEGDEVDDEHEG